MRKDSARNLHPSAICPFLPPLQLSKIGTPKGAHTRARTHTTQDITIALSSVHLMASAGDVGRVNEPDPCVEIATLAVVHVLLMSEVMCVRIC